MNLKEMPLGELENNLKRFANLYTIDELLDNFNFCTSKGDTERKEIIAKILELKQRNNKKSELEFGGDVNEIINGDFNIALDYLEKNCKDIDDGFEYHGKPLKKVTITLPKTNGFDGSKLIFYVEIGDGHCNGKKFKENNCMKYSFSRNDITNILNSIKKFLISIGVNPYEKIDTFDEKYEIDRSEVCLKHLLGLEENKTIMDFNGKYRLKDKLFGFSPDYYQLVSKENGLVFERGLYKYTELGQSDYGKLLLKSLPNGKER